ncbi:MMPL family transporter [Nocardia sp. 004]|uniref:MMPL family transporter n=1 Tax=Nocardia sp. 004 TaxID=3385978 RepID=UPI0039A04FA9
MTMRGALERLGDLAFRYRRAVVAIWGVVLALLIGGVAMFGQELDERFTVPGAESQQALDTLTETAPGLAGATAQIVFTAPPGRDITEPGYRAAIQRTLDKASQAPQATGITTPEQAGTISADKRTAVGVVNFPGSQSEVKQAARDAIDAAAQSAQESGLQVAVGGTVYNVSQLEPSIMELIGLGVAVLVLIITFGSLLAAGMPLLSALFGVAVALAGLLTATSVVTVSSTAMTLALMLGLAVGIDYSLFILSRHRAQLAKGMAPHESAVAANVTAGGAVVFAGMTVIIALAAMSVIGIPYLTVMGLAAAMSVFVAVAVAVTFLPALAGFAGARLTPRPGSRSHQRATGDAVESTTMGGRWARMVTARPLVTTLVVVGAMAVLAVPAASLRMALPDNGSAAADSGKRQAYDTISEKFGPGFNGPLVLLVDGPAGTGTSAAGSVATTVRDLPNVAFVAPPQATGTPDQSVVMIVPSTGPQDEQTADLVNTIRDTVRDYPARNGTTVTVTGNTAVNIDVSERLADSLLPFLMIVVGLSLLLLIVVFRSIAVPVKATVSFLLSIAASLGMTVAVFQWGWGADLFGVSRVGPVVSFLPIILVGVLFGLAMDYEVFLVSGIKEEWNRTHKSSAAIIDGTRHNARVVTAAATIMVVVFASFIPTDDAMIKPMAFALATGVLVDAFVIRLTLVPAILELLGRHAWWLPRPLDRILPTVDLEGHRNEPNEPEHVLTPTA